ncbi:unnamed protein product [Boreogadus saida]
MRLLLLHGHRQLSIQTQTHCWPPDALLVGLRAGWAQASVDSGCGLYESGPGESCHRPLATHAALAFYRRLELVKGVAACALFFRGLFQASQAALQTDAQVEATGYTAASTTT